MNGKIMIDIDKILKEWKVNINKLYKEKSGNEYLNIDEFHPDIKFVHYTFATNKPR